MEEFARLVPKPARARSSGELVKSFPVPAWAIPPRMSDRQRRTEDLEVVVVNLVAKGRFADLIETLELVEAHRVTVRHHEAVKKDGETLLAEGFDFFRFAKDFGSGGDEKVLAVV